MNDFKLDDDILFDPKADAVPYNYRISYKVSLICLIMHLCCGRRGCSSIKLQLINNAIISPSTKRELIKFIDRAIDSILVRFDPSVSRAINFALYENLVYRQSNGFFRLSNNGKIVVQLILADQGIMVSEKAFLKDLSVKLTEELIAQLSDRWGEFNVKN